MGGALVFPTFRIIINKYQKVWGGGGGGGGGINQWGSISQVPSLCIKSC